LLTIGFTEVSDRKVKRPEENEMMLDWNDYYQQVMARIGEIGKISPDTLRGYRELSDAGTKTGKLDAKMRELIALAVAVTRQCDGCIVVHTDAAVKHGATREEIAEALGVAIAVNAGAALVYSARVMDAYSAKNPDNAKA
ncbi:MAG: Alkylhydroperoxidase AhpD core, partial [Herminiimonas sp.]|nr:Alkylhydroperoxidase AhpD core [Herminiimonas sp.]